ncbi:hypothetical protein HPP92_018923 [Vanilla planifolia]|uniref:Uncharacterized protein n=1 Tax=Vanilla planifolia TaxID=51239 RepID=A0A835Q817_VANPL|nr:hypothetical protein HPP92_018923 [Vanilla planifolia]
MNPLLLFVVVVVLPPATVSDTSVPALRSASPSIGRKVGFCKSFAYSAKAVESDDGSDSCTSAALRSCDDESLRFGESTCVSKVALTSGKVSGYCAVGKLDCSRGVKEKCFPTSNFAEDFNPKHNAAASTRWRLLHSPSSLREDPSDEQKKQYSPASKEQSLSLPKISGGNIVLFLVLLGIAISVGYGVWLVGIARYRLGPYQFWFRAWEIWVSCLEYILWFLLLVTARFPFLRCLNSLWLPAIVALFQMHR